MKTKRLNSVLCSILYASAFLVFGCIEPSGITGHASVIDGDTIDIHGTRIRLFGIDAPESAQRCLDGSSISYRCGRDAAFALSDAIGNQVVFCQERDIDRYGRVVAVCSVGSVDLNEFLVRSGFAVAYRQYSRDYVAAESLAQSARIGIWRGTFDLPWDWRRNR